MTTPVPAPAPAPGRGSVVRVVIVAYGRTERLDRALDSIAPALDGLAGEVVVVLAPGDPATAGLARRGISCISPGLGEPRTPGANRNRGAAGASAPYLCFVDGDMELEPGFVRAAVERLAAHPEEAGCGARIHERQWRGTRLVREIPDSYASGAGGAQPMLANAWVARRATFEGVGGFDARLPSEEDIELGTRLLAAGHRLWCLDRRAAYHDCPPRPTLAEIARRWRAGLLAGPGLVLRYSWGTPLFARHLWRQRLYLATLGFGAAGVVLAVLAVAGRRGADTALAVWVAAALAALVAMAVRKRDLRIGALSVLQWLVLGAGIVRSWLGPRPRSAGP